MPSELGPALDFFLPLRYQGGRLCAVLPLANKHAAVSSISKHF